MADVTTVSSGPRHKASSRHVSLPPPVPPLDGEPVYDSARPEVGLAHSVRRLAANRDLIAVLVRRELAVRYRRSVLGVLWTLLTPLCTVLVMWAVFVSVFSVADLGVPYAVYLASGVLIVTAAQQGIQYLGASFQVYEPLIARVHVPVEVLAAGSIGAIAVHVALNLVAVIGLQLAVGVGVPVTAPLALAVLVLLTAFASGLGLVVASAALRLHDVLHVAAVALYLAGFLTPTFYPLAAIDEPMRSVIQANPLTGYLDLLRGCLYEGQPGSPARWAGLTALSLLTLVAGTATYTRAARRAVVVQ